MPFGLTNAPTTFMRMMDNLLHPFTNYFVVVYLDDILIFSKSWEEHIVDEHGVHAHPTKIQFIQDWPAPTTLTELHNFLGLANFYHRFVLGFSHIAWALIQVTKGGGKAKFVWIES
jgi:hypothetical protein